MFQVFRWSVEGNEWMRYSAHMNEVNAKISAEVSEGRGFRARIVREGRIEYETNPSPSEDDR